MNDQPTRHETEVLERPTTPWKVYLASVLVVLLVFGVVTWLLGLGPFAYRQIWYGTSEIYILNMTARTVEVTLDKGTGISIGPESADRAPILGGTTHVVTRGPDGEIIEELDVFVSGFPVFYNVQGERCLVVADVSSFYAPGKDKRVKILTRFSAGAKIVNLPHNNIIWPRQTLRDKVEGGADGVAWVEIVACPLLEEEEEHVLASHLEILLTERKRREQELKKLKEIQRLMIEGDSNGVDNLVGGTGAVLGPGPKDAGSTVPEVGTDALGP